MRGVTHLPTGWTEVPLSECVDILDGQRVPINAEERARHNEGKNPSQLYPYYGATGQVDLIDDFIFDEELVLLGEDGVPFFDPQKHKAYRVSGKCWVNNHVHVLRPRPDVVDATYLWAYLNQFNYEGYVSGSTRLKLTQGSMKAIRVLLAPRNEQKRIADKVDTLFKRVDACREQLDRVPQILKRFRQSVLAAAVSGKLTADWRSANERDESSVPGQQTPRGQSAPGEWRIPVTWSWRSAADVVEERAEIVYGIVQPGPRLDVGVPYIRGKDIENGRILVQQLLKTSPEIAGRYSRASIKGGDVLLGIIRATKVAIVPEELDGANITQGTARFRPSQIIRSKFLAAVLESPAAQAWLHSHYRGIDMPGLNLADVRRLPIPIPPLHEQHEIIRRMELLLASAVRIDQLLEAARTRVGQLTSSVLNKAFRGELISQEPRNEAAKDLLTPVRTAPRKNATRNKLRRTVTADWERSSG